MVIRCSHCGADVPLDTESDFIQCTHCRSALFVDARKTIANYCMRPTVQQNDLLPLMARRLGAMEITTRPKIQNAEIFYCPYWRFDTGRSDPTLIAATDAPAEELFQIRAPAGELAPFDDAIADQHLSLEPRRLLDEAMALFRAESPAVEPDAIKISMVHLPLYRVTYQLDGNPYVALIEAVSEEVYSDDWPPSPQRKKDRVLGVVAAAAFSAFTLEAALIPSSWMLMTCCVLTAGATYVLANRALNRIGW